MGRLEHILLFQLALIALVSHAGSVVAQDLPISPESPILSSFPEPGGKRIAGPYASPPPPENQLVFPDAYQVGRLGQGPGWFVNLEVGLVKPHIDSKISSVTPLRESFTDPVQLPFAALHWTASPRVEIGYRLEEGRGGLRAGYRSIVAEGSEMLPQFDPQGLGFLKCRLNVNVIDLDYVSGEWLVNYGPDLLRDLRWAFGVRLLSAYLDSRDHVNSILDQRESSSFVGAGPRTQVEWSHALSASPLYLHVKVEASGVLGGTRQNFAEIRLDGETPLGAARRIGPQGDGVGILGTEAGLSWIPNHNDFFRLVAGYQFERFWNLGRTDDSNADLTIQGIFWRAELSY